MTKHHILIIYCIAILLICTYVPWQVRVNAKAVISSGYTFIWEPPRFAASIDIKRIGLEFFGATLIAGIAYYTVSKNRRSS